MVNIYEKCLYRLERAIIGCLSLLFGYNYSSYHECIELLFYCMNAIMFVSFKYSPIIRVERYD